MLIKADLLLKLKIVESIVLERKWGRKLMEGEREGIEVRRRKVSL